MAPLPPQSRHQAELPGTINPKGNLNQMFNGSSANTVNQSGTSSVSAGIVTMSKPRQLFDQYDHDNSGTISISEFKNLCYDMGYFLSDRELALDIKMLDVDGNGTLSYDEFIRWWRKDDRFKSLQRSEEEMGLLNKYLTHFKKFDKDSSGIIDIREFKNLYVDLVKKKMTNKSLMATLQELDINKDGKVSFNEFVTWALANCTQTSSREDVLASRTPTLTKTRESRGTQPDT